MRNYSESHIESFSESHSESPSKSYLKSWSESQSKSYLKSWSESQSKSPFESPLLPLFLNLDLEVKSTFFFFLLNQTLGGQFIKSEIP